MSGLCQRVQVGHMLLHINVASYNCICLNRQFVEDNFCMSCGCSIYPMQTLELIQISVFKMYSFICGKESTLLLSGYGIVILNGLKV